MREGVLRGRRGEEYAFILPRTHLIERTDIAERIREQAERQLFPTEKGPLNATISIGLAVYDPAQDRHEPTPEKLLASADENLYRAKNEGRNRVAT
jgi:diguanylate cyclase (GGDEF)-like protein